MQMENQAVRLVITFYMYAVCINIVQEFLAVYFQFHFLSFFSNHEFHCSKYSVYKEFWQNFFLSVYQVIYILYCSQSLFVNIHLLVHSNL